MPEVQRMSRADTAWLRMDSDVNLMMIVGVWLLSPALTLAAVRQRIGKRLLKYGRFRQRAVQDAEGACWVDDGQFDLQRHVVAATLAPRRGESQTQALQRLCAELASQRLEENHPLWQVHVIEDFEGGSAMVMRIHHAIGDGIALISVMMSITDGGDDPPRRPKRARSTAEAEPDGLSHTVLKPLLDFGVNALAMVDGQSKGRQPSSGSADGVQWVRSSVKVINDLAALALMPDDSPTLLKGQPGGKKAVAWSEPIALDEVKAVSKALGCTVNDVLLSCVAGALGGHLSSQGQPPKGQEIRAMVPVNLRPLNEAWQLGNRFGLVPLLLPIGIEHPLQRLAAVRRRMAELKTSYQPMLAYALLSLSGLFVKPVQDTVLSLFTNKTTAVMTNVPGPGQALKFCGSTLRQSLFWVPASGNIGVGVSILSYAGGVQLGLMTDSLLCPRPQAIIDRFEPEFQKLAWLALMLPWPEKPPSNQS